jgi:hypothetical protein
MQKRLDILEASLEMQSAGEEREVQSVLGRSDTPRERVTTTAHTEGRRHGATV